jgi:mRNA-degrading endonuclease toxin of MazEF toxin-antitoxin module
LSPGYPHFPLRRGDVYRIRFTQTSDPKQPHGKDKYVLVLQGGPYFEHYQTVSILLLTSEVPSRSYPTDVLIPAGTIPGLAMDSVVTCGQVFTVPKSDLEHQPFIGRVPENYIEQVDEALIVGLQIVDVLKP